MPSKSARIALGGCYVLNPFWIRNTNSHAHGLFMHATRSCNLLNDTHLLDHIYSDTLSPHWPAHQASGCNILPGSPNHTQYRAPSRWTYIYNTRTQLPRTRLLREGIAVSGYGYTQLLEAPAGLLGLNVIQGIKIGTGTLEGFGGDLWNSRGFPGYPS